MKKTLLMLLFILAALITVATSARPNRRLTVINRSGFPLGLRLTGTDPNNHTGVNDTYNFYLSIEKGEKGSPTVKTFTLPITTYRITAYYIEFYDPVYGYTCTSPQSGSVNMESDVQLSFLPCNQRLPGSGDEFIFKFGNQIGRKGGGWRRHISTTPTPTGTAILTPFVPKATPVYQRQAP